MKEASEVQTKQSAAKFREAKKVGLGRAHGPTRNLNAALLVAGSLKGLSC